MPAWASSGRDRGITWHALALPVILIAALAIRLFGLNWDNGHLFHPDERHILMVTEGLRLPFPLDLELLLTPDSPLNPKSFAYGSLIFYQLKALQWIVQTVGDAFGIVPTPENFLAPGLGGLRLIGRVLSALFDTGTVFLTYLLGSTLYSRRAGLLAALFVAFAALHIQLSHFYASDTPMTFFVILTLLFCARMIKSSDGRGAIGAAISAGLALACKISASPILAAVAVAHLLRVVLPPDDAPSAVERKLRLPRPEVLVGVAGIFLLSLVVTIGTFLVFEPYALIDTTRFLQNIGEQNAMVRGAADLPYTRQYADRLPYWYFIENLTLFGVGLPLGIAMFAGWIYVAARAIREPRRSDLLLLAFVVPYFAITGSFHAKFLRYLLPILPVLAIFASIGLFRMLEWAAARRAAKRTDWVELVAPADGQASAPEIDDEARRWAELKGLGLFEDIDPPTAPPPRAGRFDRLRLLVDESPIGRKIAAAAFAFVVGFSVLYGLAYLNIYSAEHTAVQASRWIYDNVPRGSTLANEHWEEGVPVAVRLGDGRRQLDPGQMAYRQVPLNLYENDDERKLQHLTSTLAQTDYVLFFSNRLYGTIPRLPERYPLTSRYYQMLFAEELGFELVGAFANYPEIAGVAFVDDTLSDPNLPTPPLLESLDVAPIEINLGRADEAFSVYDHPKVLVFQKVRPMSETDYRSALAPALVNAPRGTTTSAAGPRVYPSLLMTETQATIQRLGGTFSEIFNRNGFANQYPLLVWIAAMVVIWIGAVPLAAAVFPRLADLGVPFARAIGMLTISWFSWFAVSTGLTQATRAVIYASTMLLIVLGVALLRLALPRLLDAWRERRAALIGGELAFWIPFGVFVLIRMANPDLWHASHGGEKPMDLAYLMAAVKSSSYPPYDPWFAGGFLNYYYFGQIIAANLIKLTGIIPTTAYNLIVPTLFGMTFAGAYSVVYNVSRWHGRVAERVAIAAGVAGGLFVTTIGNLGGAIQLGDTLVRLSGFNYESVVPGAQYLVLGIVGLFRWIVSGQEFPIQLDWYWPSTRVIEGTINEFPFFTFLYADLHAHMLGLPFTLLAIALAVHLWTSVPPRLSLAPVTATRRLHFAMPITLPRIRPWRANIGEGLATSAGIAPDAIARLLVTGLAIGALLPINSWDFPTYLGLVSVAGLAPWYLTARRDLSALVGSLARVFAVAVLSYVLYLPFHRSFVSFYGSVKPTPDRSDVGGYLVIHGFFLAVLLSFLAIEVVRALRTTGFWRTARSVGARWDRLPHMLALRRRLIAQDDGSAALVMYGLAAMAIIAMLGSILGYSLAGILLALLLPTLWLLLVRPTSSENAFVLLLLATGLALGIVCEVVAIDGDIGRMNTVFKFYLQVWTMWAVGSAIALVAMRRHFVGLARSGFARWWSILLIVLFLMCAVYPVVATQAKMAERFDRDVPPTLDGTAYMATAVYREDHPQAIHPMNLRLGADLAAIQWIWDNVEGSPVIAEGNTPLYRWGSRVSIYTGLPTIIGWDWHQTQQRWGFRFAIEERLNDVRLLYSDASVERSMAILRKYNVSYVYVGELERAWYTRDGINKFDSMVGRGLELVYDNDGVKIYRVLGALP